MSRKIFEQESGKNLQELLNTYNEIMNSDKPMETKIAAMSILLFSVTEHLIFEQKHYEDKEKKGLCISCSHRKECIEKMGKHTLAMCIEMDCISQFNLKVLECGKYDKVE